MTFIKRTICFVLLSIAMCNVALAQFIIPVDFEDPISSINKGIKEITEEMRGGWKTISKFDTNGFLIERVNYNGDDKRKEENINYSTIGDSILSITIQFLDNSNTMIRKNFFYNKNDFNFYRFEIYSSNRKLNTPIITGDDFIYQDSMLSSYIRFGDTIRYTYNDIGQDIKRESASQVGIETREYIYDAKNALTDIITIYNYRNSDPMGLLVI